MSGSTFGNRYRITTWGESHGPAIGVVIDGCPAGLRLQPSDIQTFLDRRKPGQSSFTTQRQEKDQVEILSGVFEERTTGTPISLLVHNQDQRSRDYGNLASVYRPGHADYTFTQKYGFRDYRGGGRSSGRETIGRVAAGAIASLLLKELGIRCLAFTKAIGPVEIPQHQYNFEDISQNKFYMPNQTFAKQAASHLETIMKKQDSCGGIIECQVYGLPVGVGEPVFDKLDACLAKAILSIGSVKAVEFGDGIHAAQQTGSQHNDAFYMENSTVQKKTNHAGGILGGMSDGSPLILRASVKPTPSISQPQHTVTEQGEDTTLVIHGRHDPVIVPRAVVVVEAMTAVTLADLLLQNMGSRLEHVKKVYDRFHSKKVH